MNRSHGILAALVLAAAMWSYAALHFEPTGSGGSTTPLWDVPLATVTGLVYSDGTAETVLQVRWSSDAAEPYIWVETRQTRPPRPKPKEPPKTPAPEAPEPVTIAFKGGAPALETVKFFARPMAERSLGPLESLDGAKYGFPAAAQEAIATAPATAAFVELLRGEAPPMRLELGRVGAGSAARYVHDATGDGVYLLRIVELRRLASARGGLMDRDLLGFKLDDMARVELLGAGRTVTYHRLAEPSQWGAEPGATAGDKEAAALLKGLESLKVQHYAPDAAEPAVPPAFEARFFRADGAEPAGWLKLYPIEKGRAQARSSYTGRTVELARSQAQQALERARELLSGT